MGNFLESILSRLVSWMLGNPVLSAIVNGLIEDLREEGIEYVGVALAAIKEVSGTDMAPTDKFFIVRQRLIEQFPKASASLVDTVIQTAYRAYSSKRI